LMARYTVNVHQVAGVLIDTSASVSKDT